MLEIVVLESILAAVLTKVTGWSLYMTAEAVVGDVLLFATGTSVLPGLT